MIIKFDQFGHSVGGVLILGVARECGLMSLDLFKAKLAMLCQQLARLQS